MRNLITVCLLFCMGCSTTEKFFAVVEQPFPLITFKDGSTVGFSLTLDNRDMVMGEVDLAQDLADKKWYKRGSYFTFLEEFGISYVHKWDRSIYSDGVILEYIILRTQSMSVSVDGTADVENPSHIVEN